MLETTSSSADNQNLVFSLELQNIFSSCTHRKKNRKILGEKKAKKKKKKNEGTLLPEIRCVLGNSTESMHLTYTSKIGKFNKKANSKIAESKETMKESGSFLHFSF